MSIYGDIGFERALSNDGQVFEHGPLYRRSLSIHEVDVPIQLPSIKVWTTKEDTFEGSLRFVRDDDRGCVQSLREYGRRFNGIFLKKVQAGIEFNNKLPTNEDFYPPLHKLLAKKLNWGVEFNFSGLASFVPRLIEWTEEIMNQHENTLRQADIYSVVAVAQFPYLYHKDVWRAFCELWSPLTNTFHHAGGELGISLHDLKQIGGLPILGSPYEEFLPSNELLSDTDKFPPTVLELLRIHADLCVHHNSDLIYWEDWLAHFYRGEQIFIAFAEGSHAELIRDPAPDRDHPSSSRKQRKRDLSTLLVSEQGKLAAFLSLMLSRFVLPQNPPVIRPETFVMACLMAQGTQISLAPTVLAHIYHGLNEMATHPTHPGRANPSFGIHFVIGWMSEYFPSLYRVHSDQDFPRDYPFLRRCAGLDGKKLEIHTARLILRHATYVRYRVIPFGEPKSLDLVDAGGLSDIDFERLLCIRSTVLPIRMGQNLILEPYYPNRFARQFGFDQGVPANALRFTLQLRSNRSLGAIASCYACFFQRRTGEVFHIPPWSDLGRCTWGYCAWWVAASTPYLSQSVYNVHVTLTGRKHRLRDRIYLIEDVRKVVSGLKGVRKTSDVAEPSSSELFGSPIVSSPVPSMVAEEDLGSLPIPEDVLESCPKYISMPVEVAEGSQKSPLVPANVTRENSNSSSGSELHPKRKKPRHKSPMLLEDSGAGNEVRKLTFRSEHYSDEEDYDDSDPELDFDITGATSTNLEMLAPLTNEADDGLIFGLQQQPLEPIQNLTDSAPIENAPASSAPIKNALASSAPIENAPASLDSLFPDSVPPYLRTAVMEGIKAIAKTILASQSALTLLSTRDEVFKHLKVLKLTTKAAEVDDGSVFWIVSQVNHLFEKMETIAAAESTIDSTALNEVSTTLSHCNEDLASEKKTLAQVEEDSLAIKEQELAIEEQEREVLLAEEKLRTLKDNFARNKEALTKRKSEAEHRIRITTERQQSLEKLEWEGKAKLEDLNSKKAHLQTLIATFTSFASI